MLLAVLGHCIIPLVQIGGREAVAEGRVNEQPRALVGQAYTNSGATPAPRSAVMVLARSSSRSTSFAWQQRANVSPEPQGQVTFARISARSICAGLSGRNPQVVWEVVWRFRLIV